MQKTPHTNEVSSSASLQKPIKTLIGAEVFMENKALVRTLFRMNWFTRFKTTGKVR